MASWKKGIEKTYFIQNDMVWGTVRRGSEETSALESRNDIRTDALLDNNCASGSSLGTHYAVRKVGIAWDKSTFLEVISPPSSYKVVLLVVLDS